MPRLGDSLIAGYSTMLTGYILKVDMDNLLEMITALKDFKMRNDTTLADLLSKEDYEKVKEYMESKGGLLPFSKLETYKPMLASSLLMESGNWMRTSCSNGATDTGRRPRKTKSG
jgi:hypothetical protein